MKTPRASTVGVLGLVLAAYVVMAASTPMPGAVHGDGYYTYLWARTIVFDGDFDFHDDYRICDDPWGLARAPVADDVNYWNMGPALFWIPPLAWERLTSPSTSSSVRTIAEGCVGPMAEHAVFGSLLAAWLTVLLGYLVARRHVTHGAALFGAALVGLASSLAYYGTMMLSYGHAASAFSGALFLLAWDHLRARPTRRGWALVGAAMGLALLMRSQNVVLAVLPLATWVSEIARERRRIGARALANGIGRGMIAAGVASFVFLPQLVYWYSMTGSPFTISQGEHYMRWSMPQLMQVAFSTGAGLFTWQPATYVCAIGLLAMLRRPHARAFGALLLLLCVLDAYVVSSVYDWWGSVGFPGRRFDLLAAPLIVGAAFFASSLQRWERARPGRMGLAVAVPLVIVLWLGNFALSIATGRAMRADFARTSIDHAHAYLDEGIAPIWRAIGNPLAWPGSLPWAIRYRQHPRDWDVAGSQELFYHDHQTLAWNEAGSTLPLAEERVTGYLSGSFTGVATVRGRRARVADPGSARILLLLHWPEAGRLTFDAATADAGHGPARLGLTVNGVGVGIQEVADGAFAPVSFELPRGTTRHGTNEVWLWVEGGPIALANLVVRDPQPPPTIEQRERNRQLLEERRRRRPQW